MPLSIAQQRVNYVGFGLRGTLLALLKQRDNIVQFNLTEVNIHLQIHDIVGRKFQNYIFRK